MLILIFLGLLIWSVNLYFHPDYFSSPDAAIYADTARNILEQGYPLTTTTLPQHLIYFPRPDKEFFYPQYPLIYPLTVAFSFSLLGISDFSVILSNLFFFLAAIPVIFFLAKRLFNQQVALAATVLYMMNPQILGASISGMSETLFAFELLLIVYLLIQQTKKAIFLVGVLAILAFFTRYQSLALFLPIFFFISLSKGERIKNYLAFFSGAILTLILLELKFPGTITRYLFTSSYHSQVSLGVGPLFGLEISRSLDRIDLTPLFSNWHLFTTKILFNFYKLLKEGIFFTIPVISLLYFFSLFKKYPLLASRVRWFVFSSFLIFIISLIIFIFDVRFIVPLIPLLIVFSTKILFDIFLSLSKKKYLTFTCLFILLFIILPSITYNATGTGILRVLSQKEPKPTIPQIVAQEVRENVNQDLTIASNEAAHIAWYGQRKTVFLPKTPEDLIHTDQNLTNIEAIVLISYPFSTSLGDQWDELIKNPGNFGNFYFIKQFDINKENNYPQIPIKILIFSKRL